MYGVKESKASKYHQELRELISDFLCSSWEGCFKGTESLSFERELASWGGIMLIWKTQITYQVSGLDLHGFDYRAYTLSRALLSF